MARSSRPLTLAGGAALALVAVLAVDLSFNRTYALDVQEDGAWATLARDPGSREHPRAFMDGGAFVDPNGTLTLRVRVENGYPWATSAPFRLDAAGRILAEGTVSAPPRSPGSSEFTVEGKALLRSVPGAALAPSKGIGYVPVPIALDVGHETLWATVNVGSRGE